MIYIVVGETPVQRMDFDFAVRNSGPVFPGQIHNYGHGFDIPDAMHSDGNGQRSQEMISRESLVSFATVA